MNRTSGIVITAVNVTSRATGDDDSSIEVDSSGAGVRLVLTAANGTVELTLTAELAAELAAKLEPHHSSRRTPPDSATGTPPPRDPDRDMQVT